MPAIELPAGGELGLLLALPVGPVAGVAVGESLRFLGEAGKLGLELVARGRLLPDLVRRGPLRGRAAVLDFWRGVLARYDENAIENLSLEEASPGRIVRQARLRHHSTATGETLVYTIRADHRAQRRTGAATDRRA